MSPRHVRHAKHTCAIVGHVSDEVKSRELCRILARLLISFATYGVHTSELVPRNLRTRATDSVAMVFLYESMSCTMHDDSSGYLRMCEYEWSYLGIVRLGWLSLGMQDGYI